MRVERQLNMNGSKDTGHMKTKAIAVQEGKEEY